MDVCPTQLALERYLAGEPSRHIDAHLGDCPRCQAEAERLSDDDFLRTWARSFPTEPRDRAIEAELPRVIEALCASSPLVFDREPQDPERLTEPPPLDPPEVPGDLGALGPYAIEAEVGRGGMAVVYRARDGRMGRIVALKVYRVHIVEDRTRKLFLQEVRAAARVEHDHVIRVYGMSDPSERLPYLAMEYIAGPSLAEKVRAEERIAPREAAEIVAQAADGLEAAHAAGLIHRDVKPANILLDPVTGRAKVGDFGLARIVSTASELTREGLIGGTPTYVSPEQARGDAGIDRRTDVYGLGVTLYTCLAGEPPFRGTPHMIVQQVLHDEPRPPRALNDAVPRDLETICLKAMAKEPSRRYATAGELAADLRRFLRGDAILARPAGSLERAWRWCRKNRKVATLGTAVVLLLGSLATGAVVAAVWISRERSEALAQARLAEIQRGLALDAFTSLIGGIQDQLETKPGTLELRRTLLETAREGLSRVATNGDPRAGALTDQGTVVAWKKLGDLDLMLGRTVDAGREFARAAELAERFATRDPASIPVRRELATAYDRLGEEVVRRYETEDAARYFEKANAIRRALAKEHPDDVKIRRDVFVSEGKLADVLMSKGELQPALERFRSMLERMRREPVPSGPDHALYMSDLRFVNGRIGLLAQRLFDGPGAMEAFRASLALAEKLRALEPNNPRWEREYAVSLELLGAAARQFCEWETAEHSLRELLALRQRQADAEPSNHSARRALGIAYQQLGDLDARRRKFDAARDEYREAVAVLDDLSARDRDSVTALKDRLIVRRKAGDAETDARRFEDGAKWADGEAEILSAPGTPAFSGKDGWLAEARLVAQIRRDAPRAVADRAFVQQQQPALIPIYTKIRALLLARNGSPAEAARAAEDVLALANDPSAAFLAARAYALSARSIPTDQAGQRRKFVNDALEALRAARKADPMLVRSAPYEPDFEILFDNPEFLSLTRASAPASKSH